jgi:hypothetical protein
LNYQGFLSIALLLLWFPACGFIGHRLTRRLNAKPQGDKTAAMPRHVHILDLEHSHYTVTDQGGIHARCALALCEESVYIAPNLAQLYVVEEVSATHAVNRR